MKGLYALTIAVYMTCYVIHAGLATKSPTFVAFSVGKTTFQSAKGERRVLYDKVFLNIGNGFSTSKNTFVVPASGVYQITFGGLNDKLGDDTELFLDLYKNGEYLVSAFEGKDYYGQATNTVLLQLLAGDQVYVQMRRAESGLYGTSDQVYATFSGHLIVPIYQVTTYIAGVVNTQPDISEDGAAVQKELDEWEINP